jgi:hypothetical protein
MPGMQLGAISSFGCHLSRLCAEFLLELVETQKILSTLLLRIGWSWLEVPENS